MPQIKRSHGVRVPNSQRRQLSATQVLLVKIALICFAGGVTIYYPQSVIVAAVASMVAGCTVEIIDAFSEKGNDRN
jgi:ABC-type molybdate transport system substrate-binding protein